jgi:3-oxoacyl-[acyl-carrier protein] reductase
MKCALVTGGSRGIGSAICRKLAAESDYHILINYQSNAAAAEDPGRSEKLRSYR